jgi:hypothetical protein
MSSDSGAISGDSSGKESLSAKREIKRTNSSNSSRANTDVDVNEMLAIEIHFGKGKSDTIHVRFDDKPESLAEVSE